MIVSMALSKVGQAFRDDPDLRQFILKNVTPTGRVLGTGSYGSVEEVSYKHLFCAGKKFHESLIDVENKGVGEVVHKYLQECQLMSELSHPNIIEFIGLCFLPETQLPLLVMERLETSLDDLLEHMPNLPLSLKCSVLEDVARGLLYLHNRRPPVIHRNLTSKNVLLTSSLVAKISDMGNSRIVTMRPGQMASMLIKILPCIPPDVYRCGVAFDVFLFGHLALFTLAQNFPGDEVERHEVYMKLLEGKICAEHPALVKLVKQCLQNDPCERPGTEELLTRLQGVRMGEHGGSHPIKLDLVKMKMAKQLKEKERMLEAEKDCRRQLMRYVEELHVEIKVKNRHMAAKDVQLAMKDKEIAELKVAKNDSVAEDRDLPHKEFGVREAGLRRELATEMTRLRDRLAIMELFKHILQLTWRCGPDMPFGMTHYVQSVVVQGRLYVGGGDAGWEGDNYTVMEYGIGSGKWTTLPPYKACGFAMAVISNQLVLIGGRDDFGCIRVLGVWSSLKWTHPYPEMPTAREDCSVVVHGEWLVVAGGWAVRKCVSCVEVLNTESKEWYTGPRTPTPWYSMKTAVVGDMAYFMGGSTISYTRMVYCADIPALLSHITSTTSSGTDEQIWKEIFGLQLTRSTPLTISGCLLAVGGEDKDDKAVTAIHL